MTLPRRDFLKLSGLAAVATGIEPWSKSMAQTSSAPEAKADYTLRIATGLVELAPEHIVSTTLYNGQFPGPLLRFKEGQRAVIDVHNDTDTPELVHWHGQMIPSDVDGAAEEIIRLGGDISAGENPQVTVPTRAWQAAESLGEWSLVGCTVAPGFDFSKFELADPDWSPEG